LVQLAQFSKFNYFNTLIKNTLLESKMIDLRSDTITTPTSAMRDFMIKAEVGDDVFSEDPTVNNLQNMIAEMVGKEAALFVCSGTQGNQISINAHTQPGDEVICDYNAHIFNYESGAPGMLSGVQLHPVVGRYGHPNLEQIRNSIRPVEDHYPHTRLICLENTHNRAGGTIFPFKEIERIADFAREQGLKLHLDGARLWNASVSSGIKLSQYASLFDSVS
jgi:threonine aldolase